MAPGDVRRAADPGHAVRAQGLGRPQEVRKRCGSGCPCRTRWLVVNVVPAGQERPQFSRFDTQRAGELILDRGRLQRDGYSVEALRRLAQRRLPRMVFDFCDGGAEDEITRARNEGAFADWEFLPTPLNGTTDRDQSVAWRAAGIARDHRPDRIVRHAVAAWRGRGAGGRRGRHGIHHEPRLDRHDRGAGQGGSGPTLVPELHVPRPRAHALVHGAGADRRLPGAGADRRQSGARPARARSRNGFAIPPRITWRSVLDVGRALPGRCGSRGGRLRSPTT